MIKGVIFDIDGTLLDSMSVWQNVGADYLAKQGIKPEPGLASVLFSMTVEEAIKYIKKTYGVEGSWQDIKTEVVGIIADHYCNRVQMKPGAMEYIKKYADEGIPMVLATTGETKLAGAALKRLDLMKYFKGIFSASEYNTTKNEPLLYLKAAEALGTEPGETIVFEDSLYAAETAKKAGFVVTGVYDDVSSGDWEQLQKITDEAVKF